MPDFFVIQIRVLFPETFTKMLNNALPCDVKEGESNFHSFPPKVNGVLFWAGTHPPPKSGVNPFSSSCVILPTNQQTNGHGENILFLAEAVC